MKVVFRTDASIRIGTGHVMRCLTLAEELRRQGHTCSFVCRDLQGHMGPVISDRGFGVELLKAPVSGDLDQLDKGIPHAPLLGVPWQLDASGTRAALDRLDPDWLIVDHYALDAQWERYTALATKKTMVIDDLADRSHHADVLLDQNAVSLDTRERYFARINPDCRLLLGPHFALLGSDYASCAKALPRRDGTISRVLVFVGGSDPYHLTETYLEVLKREEFASLSVDVVIGRNHPSPENVEGLVKNRAKARLYSELPTLSALMIRADLMLGAGGSTNWERMCLGLNSIVVSVAPNQDQVNHELQSKGLIKFLGKAENVHPETIATALQEQVENPAMMETRAEKMRALVDGQGCKRVVQTLTDQVA